MKNVMFVLSFLFYFIGFSQNNVNDAWLKTIYEDKKIICNNIDHSKISKEVLFYINKYRKQKNLDTLIYDKSISDFADSHVKKLISNNTYVHSDLNNGIYKAENINMVVANLLSINDVFISSLPQSVVTSWILSEGHKNNILGDYKTVGVSCYTKVENNKLVFKITMIFN
jgi:uncharacterized protein YkwD